jgi:tetratricopeptide (TPR) repeat protein
VRHVAFSALLALTSAAMIVETVSPALAGDFDPSGRGRKKPGTKPTGTKPSGTKPTGTKPSGTKPTGTTPTDAGTDTPKKAGDGDKGKSPEALMQRYTAIVLSQPGAPFPLQRLSQLYRERDGNLKKLVEEFETRAQAPGDDGWASKVALAGIYRQDGRGEDAVRTFESAIADKPKESGPVLALAQLEVDRGDKGAARKHYEAALPLLSQGADIEQVTRTLMGLSLDLKEFDAAKKHHDALVKRSQGSLFVKAELGRELFARGELERAEVEFRELVKASAGDNRALAPAYRDLGRVLAKQKKMQEAVDTLKKALAVAGGAAGIRAEILSVMTDAYRTEGKLPELIEILEKEQGRDFGRLATLGSLYEETGNVERALDLYKKALAIDGTHVDTRIKVVHLYQTAGDLDAAIKEYDALIKAAPNNPEFVFELCETLIQRGERPKALKVLKELEGRAREDDVLAAVADFYERVEEKEKAMAVLQRLANSTGGDPTFLVDLGDRYYQAGDKKRALDTWAKVRTLVPGRAKASFTLGEVYLDHDMPDEALAALREAATLEPTNVRFKKALAVALERTAPGSPLAGDRFAEAVAIWDELLKNAKTDVNLSREARAHIVSIWSVTKDLANRVSPLKQRFEADPPDLEAGRLLAEVQRKLGKLADAETTLRAIVAKAPGDEASLLALERVLVQEQNLPGAIEVLQKLADLNDKAARQYYQRMAQYAVELYRDDDAIKYAAKAVELSPDDANGHQKLGDMYKKRQDFDKAILEYRQAILRNDRLFPVYFDLAELLLSSGEAGEADKLFRRVLRSSPDEELVARAARMSMQINLGRGSLESLERELLPVAVGNPQKPIYRRLLIEVYGAMTLPLVQKVRHSENAQQVAEARAELATIGSRALKPLLDALADDRESQQRVAIEVLAYVENKSAGPTLFNFTTGQADKDLRTRAMVAVGALRDPAMLPRLEQLLAPKGQDVSLLPSDEIAVAAAWAVARTRDKKAEDLLEQLLGASSPEVRAIAAVGLGLSKNKAHAPGLLRLARATESGPVARAAALLALGHLVASGAMPSDKEIADVTMAAMDSADSTLRRAALVVAARLSAKGKASRADRELTETTRDAIARAILSGDPTIREDAIAAAAILVGKEAPAPREALSVPDGPLAAEDVLRGLFPARVQGSPRLEVLVDMQADLEKAAVAAVATSPDRARDVADALTDQVVLGPFVEAAGAATPEQRARAERATESIALATLPGFAALVKHPDEATRTRAAQVLAASPSPSATAALVRALSEGDEDVKRAVLSSVTAKADPKVVSAIVSLAKSATSWPVRVRATETLGRIGSGAAKSDVVAALSSLAKSDAYALVRESALRALANVDAASAAPVLKAAAASDAEIRVRSMAESLLKSSPSAQ